MKDSLIQLQPFQLIGLALKSKTINKDGQSMKDCGELWTIFEEQEIAVKIPGKLSDDVFAVYYDYEEDYTQQFSYFIGCKVSEKTDVPEGMQSLTIPGGSFKKITAKGKMPDCIAEAWKEIWDSNIPRAYRADFEVYDERTLDWSDAEVDIYLSVE